MRASPWWNGSAEYLRRLAKRGEEALRNEKGLDEAVCLIRPQSISPFAYQW